MNPGHILLLFPLLAALCLSIYVVEKKNITKELPDSTLSEPNGREDGKEKSGDYNNLWHRLLRSQEKRSDTQQARKCNLDPELVDEIASYQSTVDEIINYVVNGAYKGRTYETLALLTDTFGPRLSGSDALEDAIDWIIELSNKEGLENIHTEDVQVQHWVRNNESLYMLSPRMEKMSVLGLGSSVGTPPEGIVAEALVVKDFAELNASADQAAGRIVVYSPTWISYSETVKYRVLGSAEAARRGAVGSLVRSVAPFSIASPHTGGQEYEGSGTDIPSAAITVEDAEMLYRMQQRGENITLHLTMEAENLPPATSRNTIMEIKGYEKPEEVVVVAGHIDSWDVGQGAMDDGGGSLISWNAAAVLNALGMRARRTIRTILFTGEEQGVYGGSAYFRNHSEEKDLFQLMLESDLGTFEPLGLTVTASDEAVCILKEIMKLFTALNATQVISPIEGAPDIENWARAGVPAGSLHNANDKYFWFHHSPGDTMTVEDPDTLDRCTAYWTALAYVAADISKKIPQAGDIKSSGP